MGKRARKGGIANHALRAVQKLADAQADGARSTARAVELAVRDAPAGRVPPEVYGPLEVVAVMAAPVLAARWEVPVSEENLQNIVACLMDTFLETLALSTREQFDAWLTQRQPLTSLST